MQLRHRRIECSDPADGIPKTHHGEAPHSPQSRIRSPPSCRETFAWIALLFHFLLISFLLHTHPTLSSSIRGIGGDDSPPLIIHSDLTWNGGHPSDDRLGSCFCNANIGGVQREYCMCTPNLAIDLVLSSGPDHVWLVRRRDTGQLATMGGFVDVGETVESAVRRELMEEMGIKLETDPKLFGIYSDPRRDNRRHTVSVVYAVEIPLDVQPVASSDAKAVERMALKDLETNEFFADHKTILMDYRGSAWASAARVPNLQEYGDFAEDIVRSTCGS